VLLAHAYLIRHNAAVGSGRWEPLGELFHADAVVEFDGLEHPPLHGRPAIVMAFSVKPPTDALVMRSLGPVPGGAVLRYAWKADPERAAGSLRFTIQDAAIRRLVISTAHVTFAALYRFVVHPGRGEEFVLAWSAMTEHIALNRGSFGSRLHRSGEDAFIAYAQWPSREAWSAPGGPAAPELGARMKACCASIEVLAELDVAADLLL